MIEIDLAQYGDEDEIKILVGSHHKLIIDKLYGPTCVKDLTIIWEGDDWNIRNKINQLRKALRTKK